MILGRDLGLPSEVLRFHKTFRKSGFELFLVGGAVRNALLGLPVFEFDFATNATPEEVAKQFKNVIPTGLAHGTVTVVFEGIHYEVTTYRTDGRYADHRRPESVRFSESIEEDLARRDFTINGLAYNLEKQQVIDLFGGIEDLGSRTIKTIGRPRERFEEDALRMMRACRFSAQLGFDIEPKTLEAIKASASNLKAISSERIRDEVVKVILSPKPSVGFEAMRTTSLLDFVLPELQSTYGVLQNKHHKYDVYYHTMHVVDSFPEGCGDYRVRLAGLFHDIAKPICKSEPSDGSEPTFYNHEVVGAHMARRIMKRLKFSKEDVFVVSHLTRHHMFHYTSEWTDGAVRRFVRNLGAEHLPMLFQLREADRLGNGMRSATCGPIEAFKKRIEKLITQDAALKVTDLDVDGHELMSSFNLKPSKTIGSLLNHLLEWVLDHPEDNKKDLLLPIAKAYLEEHNEPLQQAQNQP